MMKKLLFSLFIVVLLASGCNASQDQTENFNTKQKCAELAQSFLKHEREIDVPENGISGSVINDQYTYNSDLNSCLVYFEVDDQGGITYNIVDLLTNKKVYTYVSYNDQNTQKWWDENCKTANGCLRSKEDFMTKFDNLFSK